MSMSRPASPAEVIPALATALRDARVDDALALYEPEAAFVPQPHAGPLTGHGAISAALTQFAAMRPTLAPGVAASSQLPTSHRHQRLAAGGDGADGSTVHMAATSADVMRRRSNSTCGILIDDSWALST